MTTQRQILQLQHQQQRPPMRKDDKSPRLNSKGRSKSIIEEDKEEEEMTSSALAALQLREEEFERKRMEVKEKVQARLVHVEEMTDHLARIRMELEALADPMRKEVAAVRKKIEVVTRDLRTMGQRCQRKEKEYRDVVEAFNEKSKEKSQLITRLMKVVGESEKLRLKKLEELNKHVETLQ